MLKCLVHDRTGFLIYYKKTNLFKLIDTENYEAEDAEKELLDIIEKRITREVLI